MQMKFCKDCKWYCKWYKYNDEYLDECNSPLNGLNMITGKISEYNIQDPDDCRDCDLLCGYAGVWFEPKDKETGG